MWFVLPGLLFLAETISRISWVRSVYQGRTYIQSVSLLPSEVTHLNISRPPGFNFRPGDYVYIKIPGISKHEWHPFTISSAPEQLDGLSLHIRCAGSWTKSLRDFFVKYHMEDVEAGASNSSCVPDMQKYIIRRRASSIAWAKQKPLKAQKIDANIRKRTITKSANVLCHIDGPYGTPSRHIFQSEHAVLIGSGIGITPFASILQSIVHQFKATYARCPKCSYLWCHSTPASVMNLRKVSSDSVLRLLYTDFNKCDN
ncbi:NADPH oxidase 5 [Plakobranchus ocellatus]|uniref:NADPH oxidase 5 n=1 Tax=Plakobranchus ocellatus TaxID=259542 RepID=A0AAV4BMH1_9GAST|nr:NADPH oxidase 5 [Plakobranchus ocellatus]